MNINIEEMLKNGMTPDEIINTIATEVNITNTKLQESNAKALKVKKAREDVINSLVNYFITIDILTPADAASIKPTLEDIFTEEERYFAAALQNNVKPQLKKDKVEPVTKTKPTVTDDDLINEILKLLK